MLPLERTMRSGEVAYIISKILSIQTLYDGNTWHLLASTKNINSNIINHVQNGICGESLNS